MLRETLVRRALVVGKSRLLHFFAVGLVVWCLMPARRSEREVVVESPVVADALRAERARVARRLTDEETQRVMAELVADEVLLREGLRLGVGVDDPVVRGRIADRMRGHLAAASPAEVTADEARDEAAKQAARMPVRIRLALAFVSKERARAAGDADALARALATAPDAPAPYGGDRVPIDAVEWWREEDLARAAGPSVARAAAFGPIGGWSAPIASAWGFFLVRPLERRDASPSEAMESAIATVRARKLADSVARAVGRVSNDYDVTVHSPPGEPAFDRKSIVELAGNRARAPGVD
ncbi:MAG: hypothetical protein JWP87_5241 [Labilithrix sp.]|nr:hypothetical protein [Labilithrix sp.]